MTPLVMQQQLNGGDVVTGVKKALVRRMEGRGKGTGGLKSRACLLKEEKSFRVFNEEKFRQRAAELEGRRWAQKSSVEWFYTKEGGLGADEVYTSCLGSL